MSPEISLNGHQSKGHDTCPPVPVVVENTRVRVGGKAVACVGDALLPHGCDDHSPHQGKISKGAAHVRIAGRSVARKGDSIDCGPALDELAEGAKCVRVGNCGDDEYSRELIFNMLTSPQDKAILCMEEIALAEAARASERNRKGWKYLSEMIVKWHNHKHDCEACTIKGPLDNGGQAPYFIDWQWMMEYARFSEVAQEMIQPDYLFGPLGKAKLASILEADGAFLEPESSFNYIELPWSEQRSHAFQNKSLSIPWKKLYTALSDAPNYFTPDGLQATVANVTIFALAAGKTCVATTGNKEITVERVAFFIHDGFDFSGDQKLGWWDCDNKEFSYFHSVELSNKNFRNFRERTGYGCDFRIMTVPESIWQGSFSYGI